MVTFEDVWPFAALGGPILGPITLVLGYESTDDIYLSLVTEDYLREKLEGLSAIGPGNVKVSVWPGRWLIEFVGDLAGTSLDLLEVNLNETDMEENAAYQKVFIYEEQWADSGIDDEVLFPYPHVTYLGEGNPSDEGNFNDAIAGGNFGFAYPTPGTGLVVTSIEPRIYLLDGQVFYKRLS